MAFEEEEEEEEMFPRPVLNYVSCIHTQTHHHHFFG